MRSRVGARSTGAVYEVDSDTWTVLPDAPWAAVHPGLVWEGGDLVYLVVGTQRASVWQQGRDPVSEAWVLDLAS